MNEKAKKALKKLLWSFCCFIATIIALNWLMKSYTQDMEEKTQSIPANIEKNESEEKELKNPGKFSNAFAYMVKDNEETAIVSLDYTNTSGEIDRFSSHYKIRAFQNGIELEPPIVLYYDENEYQNRNNDDKNIKDGITITIEQAYNIENTEDEIEVEIYFTTNMYMSEDKLLDTINVKIIENPYISET